ncbi:MAG: BhlA/UviB family holin-like peptide [Acidaminococcus sp.]|nr:BhlA/UviB family holin-like peptide [Acidaminococcus sp.]MDD7398426.1 BhlA/UviB family holin-like peptide [Bacillota bacterium]MDY5345625.1 BhlA/UviB family holin-like peptide [Eubacteriales bacterium]
MWENFLSQILANGVWACLFVILLAFTLKENKAREQAYEAAISSLTDRLKAVETIACEVKEISQTAENILLAVSELKPKNAKGARAKNTVVVGEDDDKREIKVC